MITILEAAERTETQTNDSTLWSGEPALGSTTDKTQICLAGEEASYPMQRINTKGETIKSNIRTVTKQRRGLLSHSQKIITRQAIQMILYQPKQPSGTIPSIEDLGLRPGPTSKP